MSMKDKTAKDNFNVLMHKETISCQTDCVRVYFVQFLSSSTQLITNY